jgi:hypothetical protein
MSKPGDLNRCGRPSVDVARGTQRRSHGCRPLALMTAGCFLFILALAVPAPLAAARLPNCAELNSRADTHIRVRTSHDSELVGRLRSCIGTELLLDATGYDDRYLLITFDEVREIFVVALN